ncbi:hypothetical protein EXW93_05785 [Exiguobacterium sp. JMULE1]|nr:hypothetical protein [Exiguobacterium sp. JMULE1]
MISMTCRSGIVYQSTEQAWIMKSWSRPSSKGIPIILVINQGLAFRELIMKHTDLKRAIASSYIGLPYLLRSFKEMESYLFH